MSFSELVTMYVHRAFVARMKNRHRNENNDEIEVQKKV